LPVQYNPVDAYLQEAEDLLADIEEAALSMAGEESGSERLNQLFRAFHTIKGSGAMCGFHQVAQFTHHVETVLDQVRKGAIPVSEKLTELVLSSKDEIRALLAADQKGESAARSTTSDLIAMLEGLSAAADAAPPAETATPADAPPQSGVRTWHILFRPSPELMSCGGSPVLLFRDLRSLGECQVAAQTDHLPLLEEIQPGVCYLWWTITLTTGADRNAIRDVFLFVEDDSTLEIEVVADAPAVPQAGPAPAARAAEPRDAQAAVLRNALSKESTVRVPSARLDRLVGLVGELVVNQSRLAQAASHVDAPELAVPVEEIERLVAELRDDVLGIRMMPIGTIFGRFRRLVHDLSAELGKQIDLVTSGEETELDKSILDQLGEPLVHLLRNSIDHGIEVPERRTAAGKAAHGVIRLAAVHTGSEVVVTVGDDGQGLNLAAIRAKAAEKQLIAADANLSDKEVFNLILLPGFSTASQVTNVSGRGVGMDVVKRQIDALRGTVSIASDAGKGTLISLRLPLTLAIIEGLLVEVCGDRFIIPMSSVAENIELDRAQRSRNNGRNVTAVRGELVPYVDLREAFRLPGSPPPIEKVVIVHHDDQRVGLVVDRVLGTHQTVLQALGRFLRNVEVVSGSTVMGDGSVALILDIRAIVRFAERQASAARDRQGPQ
jgi:two-component system, chemotaxis family, sensor kinase CheA